MKLAKPVQDVIDLLEKKGMNVRQEVGARHIKIFIGERLAGIHPKDNAKKAEAGRGAMNVACQIKRIAREMGVTI